MKIKQEKTLENLILNLQIASGLFQQEIDKSIKRVDSSFEEYEKQMKEIREKYLA